jgi:hypothetical protein
LTGEGLRSGGPDAPPVDSPDSIPQAYARWLLDSRTTGNDRAWLVTNTYDPKRLRSAGHVGLTRDRVGVRAFRADHLDWWDAVRAYAPTADILLGGEPHKSDSLHGHALVLAPEGFRWQWAQAQWYQAHGFSRWDAVRVPEAAGAYAGKYAVKAMALVGVAFGGGRLVIT